MRTENPRVDGSIPSLATIFIPSGLGTWFTCQPGDIVDTSEASGLPYAQPRGDLFEEPQIEIDEADSGDRRRACADSSSGRRFGKAAQLRPASRSRCGSPPCRSLRSRNLV